MRLGTWVGLMGMEPSLGGLRSRGMDPLQDREGRRATQLPGAGLPSHSHARKSVCVPENARDRWLKKLRSSLEEETFVKLTLSRPRVRSAELRNVYGRIVDLRAGHFLSLTLRHATRDTTRNVEFHEAIAQVGSLLSDNFEEGHLFTTTGDWKLKASANGEGSLKGARPTFAAALSTSHDRAKQRALEQAPFLTKLGVTDADGAARPGMADKLRQIERFVEILGHLVEDSALKNASSVTAFDMGAGKGYLTFATREYFRRRDVPATITGVELRDDLVQQTNEAAAALGMEGLSFARGSIADFALPAEVDLLIALHACDTATDDALAAGIRAGAKLMVLSPCCHKEIRRQLTPPPILREVLRHGILAERQAELLTDGLRAMVLEAAGYETKVFEFISSEHTAKNLMIAGIRRSEGTGDWEQARRVMAEFGIERFHLLDRLAEFRAG